MKDFSWKDKKSGQVITGHKIYTSISEAAKVLGEDGALKLLNRALIIDIQNAHRRGGQAGQRAKISALLEKLKANPELAKKLGIDVS